MTTRATFRRWTLSTVAFAALIALSAIIIPHEARQTLIPAGYLVISVGGLVGAISLYRLSRRLLEEEGRASAFLAFCFGTMLLCEAFEQGWWVVVRAIRYMEGAPRIELYDHWIITAWTAGLAASILALIPVIATRRRQ